MDIAFTRSFLLFHTFFFTLVTWLCACDGTVSRHVVVHTRNLLFHTRKGKEANKTYAIPDAFFPLRSGNVQTGILFTGEA